MRNAEVLLGIPIYPSLRRPDLYPSRCSLRGNWTIPILPAKLRAFEDRERSVSNNGIIFDQEWNELHEEGAASPEMFVFGLVRVYSQNLWIEGFSLADTSRTGSFTFPADRDVWSWNNP